MYLRPQISRPLAAAISSALPHKTNKHTTRTKQMDGGVTSQMDAKDVQFEGKIRGHYVYRITAGLERPTRYIFKRPWTDTKLNMAIVMGEETFTDSKGRAVLVFEEDEAGYGQWANRVPPKNSTP